MYRELFRIIARLVLISHNTSINTVLIILLSIVLWIVAHFATSAYKKFKGDLEIGWIDWIFRYFLFSPIVYVILLFNNQLPSTPMSLDSLFFVIFFLIVLIKSNYNIKSTIIVFLCCFIVSIYKAWYTLLAIATYSVSGGNLLLTAALFCSIVGRLDYSILTSLK